MSRVFLLIEVILAFLFGGSVRGQVASNENKDHPSAGAQQILSSWVKVQEIPIPAGHRTIAEESFLRFKNSATKVGYHPYDVYESDGNSFFYIYAPFPNVELIDSLRTKDQEVILNILNSIPESERELYFQGVLKATPKIFNTLLRVRPRMTISTSGSAKSPFALMIIDQLPTSQAGEYGRARDEWIKALKAGTYAGRILAGRIQYGAVPEGSHFFFMEFETKEDRDTQSPVLAALERNLGKTRWDSLVNRINKLVERQTITKLQYRPDLSYGK